MLTRRLWSIETRKVVAQWTGHADTVLAVCWNGDGERVLSGSEQRESGQTGKPS